MGAVILSVPAPFDRELRARLARILIDCVAQGASVGFLAPLGESEADAYWSKIEAAVAAGRCVLLGATHDGGALDGVVQLDLDTLPNQRHRASLSKLLVDPAVRRRGLGAALLEAAELAAPEHGRWLLTLDTATDAAERLYERAGWIRAGFIPDYALDPDGTPAGTALYFKRLQTV
jgi:ribosomal protein S18 acetylase RimI-like enzyme